jgi:hypothetical protein
MDKPHSMLKFENDKNEFDKKNYIFENDKINQNVRYYV